MLITHAGTHEKAHTFGDLGGGGIGKLITCLVTSWPVEYHHWRNWRKNRTVGMATDTTRIALPMRITGKNASFLNIESDVVEKCTGELTMSLADA